jgi:Tfp pilus assembly protein PilN
VSAKLNLASEPFGNRALPWTLIVVITLSSLIALAFILRAANQTRRQVDSAQRDVISLRQQMDSLKQKSDQVKVAFSPEQLQVLQAAQALVDRKRFSWSRLFSDLEAALPGTVRVARISVKNVLVRGDQTVADLQLTVVSKNAATITQMIADMDAAGTFHAELVSQNLQKGRGESGTEYVMNVHYEPRNGVPTGSLSGANVAAIESSIVATNGGRR